jgi:hypothetical protein
MNALNTALDSRPAMPLNSRKASAVDERAKGVKEGVKVARHAPFAGNYAASAIGRTSCQGGRRGFKSRLPLEEKLGKAAG